MYKKIVGVVHENERGYSWEVELETQNQLSEQSDEEED